GENERVVAVALSVAYLVFGAGAIFTGYKPNPFLWINAFIITLNFLALIGNIPTPPQEPPTTTRNPDGSQDLKNTDPESNSGLH
ncbi:hypothetical protein KW791_03990, partial [Candidatus Parcubacteria bacterium]|nr:hypothetical protein [Candidatus Parcubacteria bacterium]